MLATINSLPTMPLLPEVDSIQWRETQKPYSNTSKSDFATHKWQVTHTDGVCPKTSIQVSRTTMNRSITKLNKTTNRFTIIDEWQVGQHKCKLRTTDEFDIQLEWTEPIMGEVIFHQKDVYPPYYVKSRWGYGKRSYGRQITEDIRCFKWEWIEDGFQHTIQKFEGPKVKIEDTDNEWQQRMYWRHTRSDGNSEEIIDSKDEVITYNGEIIVMQMISSSSKTEFYHYSCDTGKLYRWYIEQGEVEELFEVDEQDILYNYRMKVDGKMSWRIRKNSDTSKWEVFRYKENRIFWKFRLRLDENNQLRVKSNGLVNVEDDTTSWWTKLDLPKKMLEAFSLTT
ncbi:hypothetical protein [Shimazuella alba]|uniref:Uncharacterized protein n=1 Tax=Shimazuella alba TaxID=2690964 RepID=A0A6I4VNG6_9BACL|nr:hypothetical protein [Shimazuella alba]MXQ53179.1 hypothetical protein [Shimazuella alba]